MKALHRRSDWLGGLQTVGYLGIILLTGTAVMVSNGRVPIAVTILLVFLHGTVCAFLINGIHELCHGTVFRTGVLNDAFLPILGFVGWNTNYFMFWASHQRHHRYTLHPPDDLEVELPMHLFVRHFLLQGFVDLPLAWKTLKKTCQVACGHFEGEWNLTLYPESAPKARRAPVWWARTLLLGHGFILALSIHFKLWLLPVVTTLAPFYGAWIFFFCNNSQHMGLQDNVRDFRLCCRTILLNPVLRFLYWHMNYHTEHHMYAAVPCYRLGTLHKLIRHDLPPCPHGLAETWKQIAQIQRSQAADPSYRFEPKLPSAAPAR